MSFWVNLMNGFLLLDSEKTLVKMELKNSSLSEECLEPFRSMSCILMRVGLGVVFALKQEKMNEKGDLCISIY